MNYYEQAKSWIQIINEAEDKSSADHDSAHNKDSKVSGSKSDSDPREMAKQALGNGTAKETKSKYVSSPAKLYVLKTEKKIGTDALIKVTKLQSYPKTLEDAKDGKDYTWEMRPMAKIPVRVYKNEAAADATMLAIITPDAKTIWTAYPIKDVNGVAPMLTLDNIDFWSEHGFAGK